VFEVHTGRRLVYLLPPSSLSPDELLLDVLLLDPEIPQPLLKASYFFRADERLTHGLDLSPEIDSVEHGEDEVKNSDHDDERPFAMERDGTDEPILAVGALGEPLAADDTPAPGTIHDLTLVCLISQLDVLLELSVQVKVFSAIAASDFCRLEIVPDDLLATCRAFDYEHEA
jgi:hypothetical protein